MVSIVLNRNRPEYREQHEAPAAKPAAGLMNAEAMLALPAFRAVKFKGRAYRVPPLTYTQGVAIQHLFVRLQELDDVPVGERLTAAVAAVYARVCSDAAALCGELFIPCGPRKYLRHILPNPFTKATEIELRALLDFLALCRTNGAVRLRVVAAHTNGRT